MSVILHPSSQKSVDSIIERPGGTLLFYGPAGVGKRTTAIEVARRMNCLGCENLSCKSCIMAKSGNHPDILILTPDDKGKVGIEAVHELQHDLRYQQYQTASHRVVIITYADTITLPAQNALLKTLEEPPAGTTIIMTAVSPSLLLPTVISRCRLLYLAPQGESSVRSYLQTASLNSEEAVRLSRGLVGRAHRLALDEDALAREASMASKAEELVEATNLSSRLQVAAEAAKLPDLDLFLDHVVGVASKYARQGSYGLLEATERLRLRLKANVSPKNALDAFAVELQ